MSSRPDEKLDLFPSILQVSSHSQLKSDRDSGPRRLPDQNLPLFDGDLKMAICSIPYARSPYVRILEIVPHASTYGYENLCHISVGTLTVLGQDLHCYRFYSLLVASKSPERASFCASEIVSSHFVIGSITF